jgi:hypothetical protein
MSRMRQENVEKIATEYAETIGLAPLLVAGSEFDDSDNPPIWRVFICSCESSEKEIGLPDSLVIDVNDLTGEASHIASL